MYEATNFHAESEAASKIMAPGIAPAFFTRVDHPLHWLDRGRWIVCCMCLTGLLLMLAVVKHRDGLATKKERFWMVLVILPGG